MIRLPFARPLVVALALVAAGCAPRARPLVGAPVPELRLPSTELPAGSHRVLFRWKYQEAEGFGARGEGVARVASPDSARLDFFVDGGMGGGWALLLGDRVTAPGGVLVRRLLPPAPMLWAALGRVAVPPARDTTARASGDTLRADIGGDPTWRVTFVGPRLTRVDRIDGGRLIEWIARDSSGALVYQHETGRRALTLSDVRTEEVGSFAPETWRRP